MMRFSSFVHIVRTVVISMLPRRPMHLHLHHNTHLGQLMQHPKIGQLADAETFIEIPKLSPLILPFDPDV